MIHAPHVAPTLALEAPSVCCYTHRAVFIMVWRDAPSDQTVDDVHAAILEYMDRIPGGFSVISVIERDARPPSPRNRARIAAFQEQIADRLKRIVLCVDGMGFVASVALAAATSIVAARRARFPQDVVRSMGTAVERLLRDRHVAAHETRDDLLATLAEARRDAAERSAKLGRSLGDR
jgi:hypothetical protein